MPYSTTAMPYSGICGANATSIRALAATVAACAQPRAAGISSVVSGPATSAITTPAAPAAARPRSAGPTRSAGPPPRRRLIRPSPCCRCRPPRGLPGRPGRVQPRWSAHREHNVVDDVRHLVRRRVGGAHALAPTVCAKTNCRPNPTIPETTVSTPMTAAARPIPLPGCRVGSRSATGAVTADAAQLLRQTRVLAAATYGPGWAVTANVAAAGRSFAAGWARAAVSCPGARLAEPGPEPGCAACAGRRPSMSSQCSGGVRRMTLVKLTTSLAAVSPVIRPAWRSGPGGTGRLRRRCRARRRARWRRRRRAWPAPPGLLAAGPRPRRSPPRPPRRGRNSGTAGTGRPVTRRPDQRADPRGNRPPGPPSGPVRAAGQTG